MREIICDYELKVDNEEVTIDIAWFVRALLNADQRFNSTGAGIRSSVRIERALEERSKDGKEQLRPLPFGTTKSFRLEEEDWKNLRGAAEDPSPASYPIRPARKLLPFIVAVTEAKEVK